MKKFVLIVVAVVCGIVLFAFAKAYFIPDKYYGVFIGIGKEDGMKLNNYEVLVLEPTEFNKDDIKKLHEKNKKIYAYLDIGSLENYRPYYDKFKDKILGNYENWEDEYWMDVSDKEWQNLVVGELAKEIVDKGFDGFFIDNCDVYYQFQDKNIFDGVNQESVFTEIDFENKKYGKKSAKDREYFIQYLNKAKMDGLKVFLTEYKADIVTLQEIEKYCKDNGFHWYNARNLELK